MSSDERLSNHEHRYATLHFSAFRRCGRFASSLISRERDDKMAPEIDTIQTMEKIYKEQLKKQKLSTIR